MEYRSFSMQDFEADGEPLLTKIDYLTDMFDLEVQNEHDKPMVITLREKDHHFAERRAPHVSVELNNCPTHGPVDNNHRCLDWEAGMRPLTHDGPADYVKYLGMTENGTKSTP